MDNTTRINLLRFVDNANAEFKNARKIYDDTIRSIRAECPHDYKYHPDPSGNNDSEYVCEVCGNSRRRLP